MWLRTLNILFLSASLLALAACPGRGGAEVPAAGAEDVGLRSGKSSGDSSEPAGSDPGGSESDPETATQKNGEAPDALEPTSFAGFSSDEASFAYAAYSSGAGVHIFTVVDSATGRRITDLPLYDAKMKELARRILEEGGFSSISADGSAVLESGETLRMAAEPGSVLVQLVSGESVVTLTPPGRMAEVATRLRRPDVDLWGFSPRGTYLAVRVTDDQGSVLGEATTYQVMSLPAARQASAQ